MSLLRTVWIDFPAGPTPGVVIEDRGCIGVQGQRLLRVRFLDGTESEIAESELVPPPAAALLPPPTNLGWHVISGEQLMELLRRAHEGEDPDLLYVEEYANAEIERIEGDEK